MLSVNDQKQHSVWEGALLSVKQWQYNTVTFTFADNSYSHICFTAAFKIVYNLNCFFFIDLSDLRWPPLFVQTAFVQKAVSKMAERNERKSYRVNRVMHRKKVFRSEVLNWKEVSICAEWMKLVVWKARPNVSVCSIEIERVCECSKKTGSAFSAALWQQINVLFLPSQKLASFQVTCSNVNPDTAADVKWRVADKKNC